MLSVVSDGHVGKGVFVIVSASDADNFGDGDGEGVVVKCYIRSRASAPDRVYVSPKVVGPCEPPYSIPPVGKYVVVTPQICLKYEWDYEDKLSVS